MENDSRKAARETNHRSAALLLSFVPKIAVYTMLVSLFINGTGGSAVAETGLSLSEVIRLSLDTSSKIKSAEHDLSAAEYAYREAKSGRFPTISLNAASFYVDELQSVNIPPVSMEIGAHENVQVDCRISIPLWTGGKISSKIKIQEAYAQMETSNLEAEKLQTAYLSRSAYFNLLAAQAITKSAEASLQRIKILKQDIQNLYTNGIADSLDLLDVELALQEATQTLSDKETVKRNASANLARLVGLPIHELIALSETVPAPELPAEAAQVPTTGQIERPELDAFDSRARVSEMLVSLSKSGYFPAISGYAGYSAGKPNRDLFNKTWNDYFNAGITLIWEFNTGGGVGYAARRAENQYFAAKTAKKDFEESLLVQAVISRANLNHAYESYSTSKAKYEIAARKFRLATNKYHAGNISTNRLLELEAELAATEQLVHASISSFYISESEFLYVTGSKRIYRGL